MVQLTVVVTMLQHCCDIVATLQHVSGSRGCGRDVGTRGGKDGVLAWVMEAVEIGSMNF